MILFLIIYAMGYILMNQALENSLEYDTVSFPWIALFWPIILLGFIWRSL